MPFSINEHGYNFKLDVSDTNAPSVNIKEARKCFTLF